MAVHSSSPPLLPAAFLRFILPSLPVLLQEVAERRDSDELLADGDVSLSDEDSRHVDGFGEVSLDDEGLESSLHELVDGQTKDVIELTLVLVEESKTDHSLDEGLTF